MTNPNDKEQADNLSHNVIENTEVKNESCLEVVEPETHAQSVADEVSEDIDVPESIVPEVIPVKTEVETETVSEETNVQIVENNQDDNIIVEEHDEVVIADHRNSAYNSGNENSKPEQVVRIKTSTDTGCVPLTVTFTTNASAEHYDFMWHFKDGTRSTEVSPIHTYTDIGEYSPVLILTPVSDEYYRQRITGSLISCYGIPETEIDFVKFGNLFTFSTINRGDIVYNWKLDNQSFDVTSFDYEFKYDGVYDVNLFMEDEHGCKRDVDTKLNVKIEHNYAMPNAFTPNEQGVNSHFGPVFSEMEGLTFTMIILDKFNQVVFETDDIYKPWDGMNIHTNQEAEAGIYLWKIVTEDQFGNVRTRRGQVTLLRK